MRRRRRKVARIWLFLGVLAAVILIAVVVLKGFEIRGAKVEGNYHYSSGQIITDLVTDYPSHNSLYLAWKYRHAQEDARVPYLDSVQVKLISPGNVRIIVSEKVSVGGVIYGGKYYYFDEKGYVLSEKDEAETDIPLVSGISMQQPQLYQRLPADNTALLNTVIKISKLMQDTSLEVSSISFDENLSITVTVGDIDILMGQAEYLEQKVSALDSIFDKLDGEAGTLNMTAFTGSSEQITFHPKEEEEFQFFASGDNDPYFKDGELVRGESSDDTQSENGEEHAEPEVPSDNEVVGIAGFQVFDSSGTLRNDARVIGGQVVDAYGYPIDGCIVQEDGNVKDAYWNIIDPMTGTLAQ